MCIDTDYIMPYLCIIIQCGYQFIIGYDLVKDITNNSIWSGARHMGYHYDITMDICLEIIHPYCCD